MAYPEQTIVSPQCCITPGAQVSEISAAAGLDDELTGLEECVAAV
jgi:hypothetical protein